MLLVLGGLYFPVYAQNLEEVNGIVLDNNTNQPIEGVVCKCLGVSGRLERYCISNGEGKFSLKINKTSTSMLLFTLLGYKTKTVSVDKYTNNSSIILEREAHKIKEVIIKADAIWKQNDTINYSVSVLKGKEDRYLGDMLKKIPGITVNEGGGISYQGKSIQRFYIEGQDLLGSRYNMATKNLPIDAIARVQVMENDQHVKALKGIEYADKASLNIKLNNNFKQKPFGELEAAIGVTPLLCQGKALGVEFGKKQQTLLSFKTDNTGNDIASDTREHLDLNDAFGLELLPKPYIGGGIFMAIPIERKRYLDNKTYLGGINHLIKLSNNTTLKENLSFTSDKTFQSSISESRYDLLNNDWLDLSERMSNINRDKRFNASIQVESNNTTNYLFNELSLVGEWSKGYNDIAGTTQCLAQNRRELFCIQNKLMSIIKYGGQTFSLNFFVRYVDQPEKLWINNMNKVIAPDNIETQILYNNSFVTKNKISTTFFVFSNPLELSLQVNYNSNHVNTDLIAPNIDRTILSRNNQLSNNAQLGVFNLICSPQYSIRVGRSYFNFSLPIDFCSAKPSNLSSNINHSIVTSYVLNPNLYASVGITPLWDLKINAQLTHDIGDISPYLNGWIQKDYRTLFSANNILERKTIQNYSLGINYHNLSDALFFDFVILYRPIKSNLLPQTNFRTSNTLYSITNKENRSSYLIVNSKLDKYFSSLRTNVSLSCNYSKLRTNILQQEILFVNSSNTVSPLLNVNFKRLNWLSLVYSLSCDFMWQDNEKLKIKVLKDVMQNASIFLFPIKNLETSVSGEYSYVELGDNKTVSNWFLDWKCSYKCKRVEYGISMRNLFNRENYSYTFVNGVNSSTLSVPIRGREVLVSVKLSL